MADKKAVGYDLEGARKAQIPDEDSLQHLAKIHNYDLSGARDAGISDQESLSHLAALAAPAAEVYEKESPEFFGGVAGAGGAMAAAGDVLFSKGRPLFRAAEKVLGIPQDPNLKTTPRKFDTPSEVAERGIGLRTMGTAPTATENYMKSGQYISPEGKPLYYGAGETGEYSGARKAAERAIETEKMFPGIKVLPGETPIALPQNVTTQVEAERAQAQRLKDIQQQKEVNEIAEMRARRLAERNKLKTLEGRGRALTGAETIGTKVASPILGGYQLGSQGAQAYNRLTREDLQPSDIAAGATNIIGAGAGASAMLPGRLRLPKAVLSTGIGTLADVLDVRNPRKEKSVLEEKAQGGLVGYAGGKAVKEVFTPVVTKIVKASEALGPNEGKYLLPTQSDRMRSTMGDLGGSGFSKFQLEKPEYAEAKAAWGVGKKPTATGIVNVNKKFGDQAIWTPMLGSETQHHSNQHVFDMLAKEFNRQARMGNLPKELQKKINTRLANAKDTKGLFPEEFDIGNPEHLIKYGDTFNRRGALSTIMSGEGVGGTKGRIIDYPGIMQEMTDPMTLGAPTHSLGTRLFTLNNEIEYRPDLHSAFPYILKGTDQGVAFSPVPKELGIPDFIKQFKEFKGRDPGYYDLVRTIPSQQITDKYLRSLEAAGHAEGGLAHLAKGGSTTPAWQRAEGKSPSGGLNAKGRASYKRETGGTLKAPQPEGGSRKKSFCARMGGMKKKLTSAKTANDPDSRINKALRKWKC